VDIGKAWASGLADILKNSRQNKIALVAAGAAAGLAAGRRAG
jgi:H+/Cl- antiporter ClcA